MKEIVLIRGLPGSGKSTLARKMVAEGVRDYAHFEADDHFTDADGRYRYDATNLTNAHLTCQRNTASALERGRSVIVANTFTRLWEMEPYYRIAALIGCNVRVITATGEFENIHGVPNDAINRMRARWEPNH